MKIKIRDKIYDSKDQPLMLILTENEKKKIAAMTKVEHQYCAYPSFMTGPELRKFVVEEEDVTLRDKDTN